VTTTEAMVVFEFFIMRLLVVGLGE